MKGHSYRVLGALLLAVCAGTIGQRARAEQQPFYFSGNQQTVSGSVGAAPLGEFQIGGTDLFLQIPTQVWPVNDSPSTISSNPMSVEPDGYFDSYFDTTGASNTYLADINNLDLDLLNGRTANFSINTLTLDASPFPINFDLSGTLSGLTFTQTGASATTGTTTLAQGSENFDIPGNVTATLSNVVGTIGAFGAALESFPLGNETFTVPTSSNGSWSAKYVWSPEYPQIKLDGSVNVGIPLSLVTQLVATASTVNMALNLSLTENVALNYHLDYFLVPEPGSIILLAIGGLALPVVYRRASRKKGG